VKNTNAEHSAPSKSRNGAVKDTTHEYLSAIIKEIIKDRKGSDQASSRQASNEKVYGDSGCNFILLAH